MISKHAVRCFVFETMRNVSAVCQLEKEAFGLSRVADRAAVNNSLLAGKYDSAVKERLAQIRTDYSEAGLNKKHITEVCYEILKKENLI